MERIVDRSELLSDDGSPPPSSPDDETFDNFKKSTEFEFVEHSEQRGAEEHAALEDDELDFCLFAPTPGESKPSESIAKIRIQTPPLAEREPGFLVPTRDPSYYFAAPQTAEERQNLEAAAVTGQSVLARSATLWAGCSYPWKVLRISATKHQRSMLSKSTPGFAKLIDDTALHRRKRPGKQARLKVRTKRAATKARQEQKQRDAELKDEAEREKRTRRNREKKVKRKERDKVKKAGAAIEDAGPSTPD